MVGILSRDQAIPMKMIGENGWGSFELYSPTLEIAIEFKHVCTFFLGELKIVGNAQRLGVNWIDYIKLRGECLGQCSE